MKTYKFIQEKYPETNEVKPWLAISEDVIETLNDSDTYGNYGQKVSAYDAGDSIELRSQKAVNTANKTAKELELDQDFEIGSIVSAFDNIELYDNIIDDIEEDEDYLLYCSTSEGFNYWDGSNWKTVTVSSEVGEPSHELIDDEVLEKELNNAIEESEFVKEGFGRKVYETEKYWIVDSNFQNHFESYEVYNKDEFELEDL